MNNSLTKYAEKGPQCLQAWLTECWWLTALPQQLNRFRESSPDITLYLVWQDDKSVFCEKDERGYFMPREEMNNIVRSEPTAEEIRSNLWLERDYETALRQLLESETVENQNQEEHIMNKKSKQYGEIILPDRDSQLLVYSDQFGLRITKSLG